MKTKKLFGALMTLALALSASAVFADEFSRTEEPFVKGAQIYADGFHAFAPRAALPTPGDFVAENLGYGVVSLTAPYRPWIQYRLREPGRFNFELQRMDDLWLTLGIGK